MAATCSNTKQSAFGPPHIFGDQMPIDYQDDFKTSLKCAKKASGKFAF
jgi:hypothetical protein